MNQCATLSDSDGIVSCDGRNCGKKALASTVTQFGLCDHNICNECIINAKKKLYEGVPACLNMNCDNHLSAQSGSTEKCTEECKRTSSSSFNDLSNVSTSSRRSSKSYEGLIKLNLLVFYVEKRKLARRTLALELLRDTKMSYVLNRASELADQKPIVCCYTAPKEFFSRQDLTPLEIDSKMTIKQLADKKGEELSVVVTTKGTSI